MPFRPTTLERAFSLARSGEYASLTEIRAQLNAEGYAAGQLEGPQLLKQLRTLCENARQARETDT
jgi:hypothetical protein